MLVDKIMACFNPKLKASHEAKHTFANYVAVEMLSITGVVRRRLVFQTLLESNGLDWRDPMYQAIWRVIFNHR